MDTANPWPDIRARAGLLHALACGGASLGELARVTGNDPVVVVAAIAHDGSNPRADSVVPRGVVVNRLHRLLRSLTIQAA